MTGCTRSTFPTTFVSTTRRRSTVKIECKNSRQALVSVISYLTQHSQTINSLETLEPNLESVFLHLTGKKLRE